MDDDYDGQMTLGDLGGLKFPDICLTGEEKLRKNLTPETCPDQGSNPGPLRDRRACYHLFHSDGHHHHHHHHHQSALPKGRSFLANAGTKIEVLSKGRSSTTNLGKKVAVLLGINRCGSFPSLSTPHSLFSI